ncbi:MULTISPECIES: hypothetical protein [Lysobacter]|uniref:Lipoprotein n=1 Tax=Lysobacter firmicutimachus TaxID=1792846 RepID=A0ABU8D1V4_9GAMM|nr:hypothetical protein [Lysobacter antibioticus]
MAKELVRNAVLLASVLAMNGCTRAPGESAKETIVIQDEDPIAVEINAAARSAETKYDHIHKAQTARPTADRADALAPAIGVAELRQRILRLTATLSTEADTESENVARMMGSPFTPELLTIREGESLGELKGIGSYRVSVSTVYRKAPGKHIRISFLPKDTENDRSSICTFGISEFANDLSEQGYDGRETTLPHREQWGFVRRSSINGLTFYVKAELYRAHNGSNKGDPCVGAIAIDAAREAK